MFLRANRVAYFQPVRWVRKNGRLALGASQRFIKSGDILNHIEAILISTAEPPHNRQGGRFGEEVEQYLQYRDHQALGLDMESMVQGPLGSRRPQRAGQVAFAESSVADRIAFA